MNWEAFRKRLVAEHHSEPQVVRAIELSVAAAQEALSTFARYGHQFHLVAGPEPPPELWPRLFFHATSAPNGRVIRGEDELSALGPGWFDEAAVAFAEEANAKYYAGRGGRGRKGLPAVISQRPNENERLAARLQQHSEAREEALKEKSNGVSSEE